MYSGQEQRGKFAEDAANMLCDETTLKIKRTVETKVITACST